jgi:hypothetical protein
MWYSASLLFKSVHVPSDSRPPLWEESIRLIEAETEIDARKEAERIGRAEKVAYRAQSDVVLQKALGCRFLQLAACGKARYMVTGDRDLLEIRDKLSYAIVSADTFMSALKLR